MRWKTKPDCSQRVRSGFLWLALEIDGEARWWERASWVEVYRKTREGYAWIPERWSDE